MQSVGISLVADKTAAVSFPHFYISCAFICVSNSFAVCNLQSKAISDTSWESHFSLFNNCSVFFSLKKKKES